MLQNAMVAGSALGAAILSGGCDAEGIRDTYNPSKAMLATPQLSAPIAKSGGISILVTGMDVYPELYFKNGKGFNREIKDAVAASVEKAGLFGVSAQDSARYQLVVDIVDCTLPDPGGTMTVSTEVNYSIKDTRNGRMIWHKTIKSSDTKKLSDAITGMYRMFMAVDGAFRRNIEAAVIEMAALPPD
jgi:hypothetical protein